MSTTGSLPTDTLTDADAMTAQLHRAGFDIARATPTSVRHKPAESTLVGFDLTLPDGSQTWAHARACQSRARAATLFDKAMTFRPRPSAAGPGLSMLDAHTVVYAFPNDPRLRRLHWYADPRKLKRSLEPMVGESQRISGSRTAVTVLRHKPERRLVARIDLALNDRGGGRQAGRCLLLRYMARADAARLARAARTLRDHGVSTPAPLAQLDDGHVAVDRFIDGCRLSDRLPVNPPSPGRLAAALDHLHRAPIDGDLPRRRIDDDLRRARRAVEILVGWRHELRPVATAAVRRLETGLPAVGEPDTLVHGDLHGDNVLIDTDDLISFVDLDRVAVGSPAIDLGALAAEAAVLGSTAGAAVLGDAIEAYRALGRAVDDATLDWYRAFALVERAVLITRRVDPDWHEVAPALFELAAQ